MLRRELATMFSLSTSDDVLDEAHRVWRKRHPGIGGDMRARRELLFRSQFDDICSDWPGSPAPVRDVDDSHVHNAAAHLGVEILLTNNVRDFGKPESRSYDIYTPDEFFCLIHKNSPRGVEAVVMEQLGYWEQRHRADGSLRPKKLSIALREAGCREFALNVENCLRDMSGARDADAPAEPKAHSARAHPEEDAAPPNGPR